MTEPTSRWGADGDDRNATDYDARWQRRAAAGQAVHGEADFVERFAPQSVLDAGCGTGRVAIELARRGIDVVGVDLSLAMLDEARAKAPDLAWIHGSVDDVSIDRTFDVVVTAGNVMIFVRAGTESAAVANLSRHLAPEGALVSGFQIDRGYDLARYDADCDAAGLELVERYGTWERAPFAPGSGYAVSVHRRPR